jgi:hypothetical protein
MGWWGHHPMEGDSSLDVKGRVMSLLFTDDEYYDDNIYTFKERQKRISQNLKEILNLNLKDLSDFKFAKTWIISDHRIMIRNKELSKSFKLLLGDGGAKIRGYQIPKEYIENRERYIKNFNKLRIKGEYDNPLFYSVELEKYWDEIMEGKLKFNVIKEYNTPDSKHPSIIVR